MNSGTWLVLALAVVLLIALGIWMFVERRRRVSLRRRYGREYDRAVSERGGRRQAEQELRRREKRVESLQIRELAHEDKERFAGQWRAVQARFVDEPPSAIREADRLVAELMQVRGYPVGDFEQRAADISVHHPRVVENYRAAHEVAISESRGQANTEDLRRAMVHYRALFEELLGDRVRVAGRS